MAAYLMSRDMGRIFAAASFRWSFRTLHEVGVGPESISMEMMKIEQVIVGNERRSASAEIKSEPAVVPVQPYQHEGLQCFQCFITFCNAKAKERHMRKSHREQYKQQLQQMNTIFTCYKCDKSFSFSEDLSKHQATHSTDEKPFRCPYCQKSFFTFTELNKHRRYECIERRCPCADCGALFPSPSRLRIHRIAMHPQNAALADNVNTYQCCKCSRGFQTEEELLQHQERFANDINCNVKPPGKKRGRKPKNDINCTVKPPGKKRGRKPKNTTQIQMVYSKKIKQEEESRECKVFIASTTEGCPSSGKETELKIPCPEADCDLVFPSVTALRAHKRDSHGPSLNKAHTCTDCDESFAQPEQLKAHLARVHSSGHLCPTCGKSFTRERLLKIHLNTHTEGEEVAEQR